MTETMLHPSRAGSGHRDGAGERGCHGGQLRDLLHPLYGMDPVLGLRTVGRYTHKFSCYFLLLHGQRVMGTLGLHHL